jgi:hypothetical protein
LDQNSGSPFLVLALLNAQSPITSPTKNSLIDRGQTISISLRWKALFPRGVAIIATLPIGASDIKFGAGADKARAACGFNPIQYP